jgi:cytochrome c peroxidase
MPIRTIPVIALLMGAVALASADIDPGADPARIALGKLLFNDSQLSSPAGQSCASCHNAAFAHSDPDNAVVSAGADTTLFGNRNAPSIHYVRFNPELFWNDEDETWMGGFFLDGRAATLKEQTGGPLLNALEMGNRDAAEIRDKVQVSEYAALFKSLYGPDVFSDPQYTLDAVADAIIAYENGPEFALFTSKYDYFLQGKARLTALEQKGLELFEDENKGNCAACHPSQPTDNGIPPLFTDFSYDNLGAGVNKDLPFLGMSIAVNPEGKHYRDLGLALSPHINNAADEKGKFKVPTLRNIAVTAPYLHNGLFATLEEVVDFYNTRDIDNKWPESEITDNVNKDELGDLGLSEDEVEAIVAFMKTLTDGYSLDVALN